MKKLAFVLVSLLASAAAGAQTPKYPPLSEFMMPEEAEIALARAAQRPTMSRHAQPSRYSPRPDSRSPSRVTMVSCA